MAYSVFYDVAEQYRQTSQGIAIPEVLRVSPEREVRLEAKLDTGAAFCLFSRQYAETLGLEVERGDHVDFSTAAGSFVAYGHEVTLIAMGFELSSTCYFYESEAINKNVLGRNGWLNKIRLGVDDTNQPGILYASQP
jgi:hypothetical protein